MSENDQSSNSTWPESEEMILEEYKLLVAERRFLMDKYMYAVSLYLVLSGLALKEMTNPKVQSYLCVLVWLITAVNGIGIFAATCFTRLALHSIRRERNAATKLRFQPPGKHLWGLWAVIAIFVAVQVAAVYITFTSSLHAQP